ncbi:MAG: hypothetical protein ABJA67_13550 [Chthonomonadales bacterium]
MKSLLCRAAITTAVLSFFAKPALCQTTVLYDGASNVTPSDVSWGWSFAGAGSVTPPGGSGFTGLSTTANDAFQAGYARNTPTALFASLGWNLRFDMQVTAEDHSNPTGDKNADGLSDRGGVSVIALGADHLGVELTFWNNEVWTQEQSPLFVHDTVLDRAFMNTTTTGTGSAGLIRYDLLVNGSSYRLYVNGSSTAAMTGTLKNYTGGPAIYNTPNFLFFGDDTTSARGSFNLSRVAITSAPEPSFWSMLLTSVIGLGGLLAYRRKSARTN